MVKRIRVIGIGMGSPEHLTVEAARALATVDVFLVTDQGETGTGLVAAQQELCAELMPAGHAYRFVQVTEPHRSPDRARDSAAYEHGMLGRDPAGMRAYAEAVAGLEEREETVGVLAWGEPGRHDSAVRVVDALRERFAVDYDVIAGISAAQLLASRHRILPSRNGPPVQLMNGPRLVDDYDPALADVVVVLDEELRCAELVDLYPDVELYWGARLGMADEVLVAGTLRRVIDEVRRARAEVRARHGWVVDAYLLRSRADDPTPAVGAWPPVDSLSDGTVAIRPFTAADWPVLLEEHNNEESLRWDFTGTAITEQQARRGAAQAVWDWNRGRAARFVIVDLASGAPAGAISVTRMGPPEVGLVGYGVLPGSRGNGFGARALELLSAWVLGETSIARLELGHKIDNVASGRVATRAGFVAEGVHPARLRNPDGTFSDEVFYGRVR